MKLIGRNASPYVRRVAVTMRELELSFEPMIVNVIQEPDRVRQFNPLARVPILVLESGETLIESAAILDYVLEIGGDGERLLARSGLDRRMTLQLCAYMTNALEKAIYAIYEKTRRPDSFFYEPARSYHLSQVAAALKVLETRAPRGGSHFVGPGLTIADVTIAVGWRFLRTAHPTIADPIRYPALASHSARCEEMPAFRACAPETA